MSKFTIKGDKELIRKLDKLAKKDIKKAIRKGSRAGAKVVQREAKSIAPKDSGQLAKSIKVRSLKRSRSTIGTTASNAFRGTEQFYGAFQEYGYTSRGGNKIEGKGFMKQASDNVGEKALRVMIDEMKQVIQDIG